MKWIELLFNQRRMAIRYAAFIGAIGPYFWDVETNGGKKSYWLYGALIEKTDYLKAKAVLNNRYYDEWLGHQTALEVITRYRTWEAQSWKNQ
jgi:hypothetical protein